MIAWVRVQYEIDKKISSDNILQPFNLFNPLNSMLLSGILFVVGKALVTSFSFIPLLSGVQFQE